MRLYIDEMYPPWLAVRLRERGIDAVSALEIGNVSVPDEQHLRIAGEERRCVVTENYDDFVEFTFAFMEAEVSHAGVLLVPERIRRLNLPSLVSALERYARAHEGDLPPYSVDWLPA